MKKIFLSAFVFLLVFLFSTCEIGLGASVDTEAPVISVLRPSLENVDVIKGSFPIMGDWSDDGAIDSIKITLKGNDGIEHEYTAPVNKAEGKANEGTWYCAIDPVADKITDGSYSVEVVIKDKAGHKTASLAQIVIDNTAPIVVLTRPSTSAQSSSFDTYGQTFTLEGQAADTNNISRIDVHLYEDADCTISVGTVSLPNVPNSINMDAAKYNAEKESYINEQNSDFAISVPRDSDGKQFYCQIVAYDGAIQYPMDGSEPSGEYLNGNSINSYYLYKDISTSILQNYKITEVYSMLSGTYSTDTNRAAAAVEVLKLLDDKKIEVGKFALNPRNNPTFSVTGRSPLAMDGNDFKGTTHNVSNGQSLVVEVSPGLDGILLEESSIKVYAILCDDKGNPAAGASKIYPATTKSESGTSYRFVTPINLSDGFAIGKNYVIGVEGYDQSEAKNAIIPVSKGYGFHMATTGKAPTLTLTAPSSANTYIGSKNASVTFSGTIIVEAGAPTFVINNGSTEVKKIEFTEAQGKEVDSGIEYYFTYTQNDFGTSSGQHLFKLTASQDGQDTVIERTIVYDKDAPNISVLSTSPVVDNILKYAENDESGNYDTVNKYLNGDVDFTVAIVDDFDVVNAASSKYEVIQNSRVLASGAITNPTRHTFTLNTDDYSGAISLKISSEDRAGNSVEKTYDYIIDQSTDKPVLLPGDSDSITFLNDTIEKYNAQTGTKKGIATVGSTLVFKLHDDDGLKSVTIKNSRNSITDDSVVLSDSDWVDMTQKESERSNILPHSLSGTDTTFSYMLPTDGGYYKFNVVVEDKNGTKTEKTFVLNVTKAAAEIKTVTPDREYAKKGLKIRNAIKIVESQEPYIITRTIGSNTETFENLESTAFTGDGFIDEIDVETELAVGTNKVTYHIKDGNERDGNTIEVNLVRDDTDPETPEITSPTSGRTGISALTDTVFTFGGKLKDNSSKIYRLWYYFGEQNITPDDADYTKEEASDGSFGISMVLDEGTASPASGHLCEGSYSLYIKAEDNAGNVSDNPTVVDFDVDRKAPTFTSSSIKEDTSTQLSGSVYYFNGALTGSASASDTAGTPVITIKLGNTEKTATWNGNTWTIAADEFTRDAIQTLTFIATDRVGKTAEKTFSVYEDVTGPRVTPTSPGTVFTLPTINGSVSDNNGVGVESILWSSDNRTYVPVQSYTGGRNDWSYTFTASEFGSSEGSRTIYFKAKDALGNEGSAQSVTFAYDANIPEVRINGTYAADNQYYAVSGFTLEGSAWDTNLLSEVVITQNGSAVDGVTLTGTETGKSSTNPATWSKTFTTGTSTGALADGAYTFKISAKDSAGRSSQEITRNILVDTKAPTVTLNGLPSRQDTKNKGYTFVGTASDGSAGSGVKEVKLTIKDKADTTKSHTVTMDGTSRWSYTLDCTATEWQNVFESQGEKIVYISASDEAGHISSFFTYAKDNPSVERKESENQLVFIYDTADPVLKVTESDFSTYMSASGLTIHGSATDSYKVGELKVTETHGSSTVSEVISYDEGQNSDNKGGTWTKTLPLAGTSGNNAEGEYSYKFEFKDFVGNTVYYPTDKEFTTTFDKTAPVISAVKIANNAVISSWYDSKKLDVSVTASDNITQILKVQYSLNGTDWYSLSKQGTNYSGNVEFANGQNTLKIKATDDAGNSKDYNDITVKVDDTPAELETFFYQIDSGELIEVSSTIYVKKDEAKSTNKTSSVTIYGKYSDADSGLKQAPVLKVGGITVTPTIEYSDSTGVLTTADNYKDAAYSITSITNENNKTIRYWKASFTPANDGLLEIIGKNNAEKETSDNPFRIKIDNKPPVPSNISLTDSYEKDSSTYYIINTDKTFTLSGMASDNFGVESVSLKVVSKTDASIYLEPDMTGDTSDWHFDGLDMRNWGTAGAEATLTITDVSGLKSETTYTIYFDISKPFAKHESDAKKKDLYFRVGKEDNDDITSSDDLWSDSLDKDVGKKYEENTYGNDTAIQLRGYVEDTDSGVKKIYYKVYGNNYNWDTNYGVNIDDTKKRSLVTEVIADNKFFVTGSEQEKRVFYNVQKEAYDSAATDAAKATLALNGTFFKDLDDGVYKQFYKNITTNFNTEITGFTEGINYLVFVVEDNVGNQWLWETTENGTTYSNFKINVDKTLPQINSNNGIKNTKSTADVNISGTVSDVNAGINIKSFEIKVNGTTLTAENITSTTTDNGKTYNWEATIPSAMIKAQKDAGKTNFSVTASVKDNAGSGNPNTDSVASIAIDDTPPTLRFTSTAGFVKDKISVSVYANDMNGIQDSKVYYNLYRTTDTSFATPLLAKTENVDPYVIIDNTTGTKDFEINIPDTITDATNLIVRINTDDTVGNPKSENSNNFTVDKNKPKKSSINITLKNKTVAADSLANEWFNDTSLVISGSFTDKTSDDTSIGSGVKSVDYKVGSNDYISVTPKKNTDTGAYDYSFSIVDFTEGSNNNFSIKAEDNAGNMSDISGPFTINIDTTAPEIKEVSAYPFDKTYLTNGKEAKKFEFDVEEELSGIADASSFTVKLGKTELTLEAATTLTGANTTKNIIVIGETIQLQIGKTALGSVTGNQTLQVYVTDKAGNRSDSTVIANINVDKKAPELKFTAPTKSTVNKTITVGGTIDEANGVESITLEAKFGNTVKKTYSYLADADNNTIIYNAEEKTWSATVNTDDLYSDTGTQACTFSVTATDVAGNTPENPVTKDVSIDQNSDRPVIKFNNLTLPSTAGTKIKYHRDSMTFEITDDDKTISVVDVSYQISAKDATTQPAADATTWIKNTDTATNKLTYDENTRIFTLSELAQAEHIIWFKINDGNKDFISSYSSDLTLDAPIIQDDDTTVHEWRTNTALYVQIDTIPPIVDTGFPKYHRISGPETTTYNANSWAGFTGGTTAIGSQYFGGIDAKYKNKLRIALYAWDDNGITSVELSIPDENGENPEITGFTQAAATKDGLKETKDKIENNPWTLWTIDINVSDLSTSSRDCKIIITDGGEKTTEVPFVLNIDNTAPYLTGSITPVSTDPVFGAVNVRGEIKDDGIGFTGVDENNAASGQMQYYIPTYAESQARNPSSIVNVEADEENNTEAKIYWKNPSSPGSSSWTIKLEDLNTTIGYQAADESVDDAYTGYGTGLDGLYRIPVWFKLIDDAGNVGHDIDTVKILYNPNADKPTVRITEPARDQTDESDTEFTYALSGGKFKIRGTAKDDIGVSAVYLQFDMDGNDSNGFENGSTLEEGKKPALNLVDIPHLTNQKGVRVTGEENWSYEIDVFNLEGLNSKAKHLKVRAIAIDEGHKNDAGVLDTSKDLAGKWSETWHIYIENTKPQISISGLRQYSNAFTTTGAANDAAIESLANDHISEKDFQNNMRLKVADSSANSAHWYLYGEVRTKATNSYIKEISTDDSITGSWVKDGASSNIFSWTVTENSQKIQKFLIPVNKLGNGEWKTKITAKNNLEESSDKTTNTLDVTLNIDNTPSSFVYKNGNTETVVSGSDLKLHKGSYGGNVLTSASTGDNTITNSNGRIISIYGKVREAESAFDKLAFYIMRDSDIHLIGSTTYKQIIASSGYSINSDGLPVKAVSGVTRDHDTGVTSTYNFTVNSVPDGVHEGGLVKIGGQYRTITEISGGTITLDSECNVKFTDVEFVFAMVVDSSNESINTSSTVSVTEYDKDGMYERCSTVGNDTEWSVALNSRNIADGPVTIYCVAFDTAGNITSGSTQAFISNNPPRLTSVMLGTDLNADDEYSIADEFKQFWASGTANDRSVKETVWNLDAKIDNTNYWTAKKDLVLIPEFVGGNADIYYRYSKVAGSSASNRISEAVKGSTVETTTGTGEQATTNPISLKKLIYKDSSDLAKLVFPTGKTLDDYKASDNQNGVIILENDTADDAAEDALVTITKTGDYEKNAAGTVTNQGVNVYRFSFWDSTTGCTVGDNSQWCVLNITMKQDIYDGTKPVGKLEPFFWNGTGSGNSSVVYNSDGKILGHIELPDDLPARFTDGGSNEFDRDPKVSGQIIVKGNATDENRIGSFTVTFENVSATATFTASSKTWGVTYKKGTAESTAAETGLSLSLDSPTTAIPTQTNHSADWTMTVDTTKVLNNAVAGVNKVITISVTDAADNGSPAYNSGSAVHNTTDRDKEPYYKVDIVPYITDVTTPDGLKDNNIRSASGKYSVIKGTDSDFIEVRGFNLDPGADDVRIVPSTSVTNIELTAENGTKVTRTSAATDDIAGYKVFKLNNALTKSGYLEVFTNGVRALNNLNKDDAYGAAKKNNIQITSTNAVANDYENSYNREPDYYTTKNVMLTDDRYIRVFDMKSTGIKNGYYPTMVVEGDDPVFGLLNLSGDATNAPGPYPAYSMPQRAKFKADGTKDYIEYLANISVGDLMGMARDDSGRFHHLSVFNRDGCAMYYIYDRFSELYNGYGWGPGIMVAANWNFVGKEKNNGLALESVNYNGLMTGRYMAPKMIAKGKSAEETTSVYIAYYDDNTGEILLRDFMIGNRTTDDSGLTKKYSNITFTYNNRIDAGGYYYESGFEATSKTTSYGNSYLKVGNEYKKITENSYTTGNWSTKTYYYYEIEDYSSGTVSGDIYTGTLTSTMEGNESGALYALDKTHSDNASVSYSQYVNFAENSCTTEPSETYDTGRITAVPGTNGSRYFDIGVVGDKTENYHLVLVYVDKADNKLKLKYSSEVVNGSNPTADIEWTPVNVSFPNNVNSYVSLAVDGNSLHITAFDSYDSNLVYMYLPNYNSATGYKQITVDQASAVGNWTQIKVKNGVPYIAYYNSTENGGRDGIKLAYPVATTGKTAVQNKENPGVNVEPGSPYAAGGKQNGSATGYTTGAWEYMTVPALTPPQGGDPKFQNVCLDFDSSGIPVVGYLGTNLEFGKALGE